MKPISCFVQTWAMMTAFRAAASIPIMCGRSMGWSNASNMQEMPTSFDSCDKGCYSRKPAPTFQLKLPASADRILQT